MFAESNTDDYLPGCCPGCQLPWTSCICSTPWSEFVNPMLYFAITDPPAFWRKKDRDEWRRQMEVHFADQDIVVYKGISPSRRIERYKP